MTTEIQTLSEKELQILQHSLGRDEYGRRPRANRHEDYRSHFVTGPGSNDYETCEKLVSVGLMRKESGRGVLCGGDDLYIVTMLGVRAVDEQSPAPPKLSRAKTRYQAFLSLDTSMSFGEFLQSGYYREFEPGGRYHDGGSR